MKILILCDYFKDYRENRASYRIRYLTAFTLAQSGNEVVFIYPESGFSYTRNEIEIMAIDGSLKIYGTPGILPMGFRTGGFGIIDCIFKMLYILWHSFDVIQVGSGHRPSNFLPSILGKYLKKAVIVDECWEWLGKGGYADSRKGLFGSIIAFYDRHFEVKLKEMYDCIIVISSELKRRFSKQEKVVVILGGAENSLLQPYEIMDARELLQIPAGLFIIGMSNLIRGDHNDNKVFFAALQRICAEHTNVHLLATGCDARYIKEIEVEFNLTGKIIFPGYVEFSEYNKHLSACDIFVLPYPDTCINRSRWPNKIGDYMCLERPIITNPTGDVKEIFKQYAVGLLCGEKTEDFYYIFNQILEKKVDITLFAKDSRFVAEELLSFDKRIKKMNEIFQKLIEKHKFKAN